MRNSKLLTEVIGNCILALMLEHKASRCPLRRLLIEGSLCFPDLRVSRFTDSSQNFLGCRDVRQSFANSPPALAPIGIHKQSSIQCDVFPFHTTTRVYQAIRANYPRTRVTQDGELAVHDLLPHRKRMLAVVHAESYKAGTKRIEFLAMTRELAQLACAVGSPIAPIEDQQYTFAALGRKPKVFAVLVPQGKLRRALANSGRSLWSRQDLGSAKCGKQQKGGNSGSPGHPHGS